MRALFWRYPFSLTAFNIPLQFSLKKSKCVYCGQRFHTRMIADRGCSYSRLTVWSDINFRRNLRYTLFGYDMPIIGTICPLRDAETGNLYHIVYEQGENISHFRQQIYRRSPLGADRLPLTVEQSTTAERIIWFNELRLTAREFRSYFINRPCGHEL